MPINESWIQALRARGARIEGNRVVALGQPAQPSSATISPLTSVGVLAAHGEDASAFLQGQLTNDVETVSESRAHLTAYCTAKGRVLATPTLWKAGGAFFLELPDDLIDPIRKRLQMYVLRSRVTLSDASSQHALFGVAGAGVAAALRNAIGFAPSEPYACATQAGATAVALPGGRCLIAVGSEDAPAVWDRLARAASPAPQDVWELQTIAAGIPVVAAGTTDRFTPQMLNLELTGAVSFNKGCYTGQEIVARTQYLGRVKRRMLRFHAEQPAQPGDRVSAAGEEVGTVVNSARCTGGGVEVLAVVTLEASGGELFVGTESGIPLTPLPLPYELQDPSAAPAMDDAR